MKTMLVRALRALLNFSSDPLKNEYTIENEYTISSGYTIEK